MCGEGERGEGREEGEERRKDDGGGGRWVVVVGGWCVGDRGESVKNKHIATSSAPSGILHRLSFHTVVQSHNLTLIVC